MVTADESSVTGYTVTFVYEDADAESVSLVGSMGFFYDDGSVGTNPEICYSPNEKIPQMLKEHPQINALFCMEGYSSDMTGMILKQLGDSYCDIQVVSFDLVTPSLQYIEEETYYSIIAQSPYEQGYLAVATLVSYLNGEPIEDTIFTDTFSIKKQNLEDEVNINHEKHSWHIY